MKELEAGLGRFSGVPDRLQVLMEQFGYFMTDIGYLWTENVR